VNKTAANARPQKRTTPPPADPFNFMMPNQAQQFMDMTGDVATLAVVIADLGENGETKFLGAPANFGPPLTEIPLVGRLVYATPGDGCTTLFHPTPKDIASAPHKTILLLDRGICMFGEKIRVAMEAGAHAVIVADNLDQPNVFLMTDGLVDTHPPVTIPSVLINKTMGERLKVAMFEKEEYMITLRDAYEDEEFADEALFYPTQLGDSTVTLNLDLENFNQGNLAEMVLKQLQQMNIQLDGQFQIQFMNDNNQLNTLVINPNNNPTPEIEPEEMGCIGEECITKKEETHGNKETESEDGKGDEKEEEKKRVGLLEEQRKKP